MRATTQQLEGALDHAPAIAILEAERPDLALKVAAACIAGGFRVLGVHGSIPNADDLVGALTPRPDTIVGLVCPENTTQIRAATEMGASFVLGADADSTMGAACEAAGVLWVPGISNADDAAGGARDDARWLHLQCPPESGPTGGLEDLRRLREEWPDLAVIASGGIAGDRIGDWIGAGARAVGLREALYSPTLVVEGASVTIRNHAAAVHREATRHSRIAKRLS